MQQSASRSVERYSPLLDMNARWPGWRILFAPLGDCDEAFYADRRLIVLDPGDDPEWAVAHATAHLDLEHYAVGIDVEFSPEQEADADGLARLRLDH